MKRVISVFDQYLLVYEYVSSFDTPIDHEEPSKSDLVMCIRNLSNGK